MVKEKQPARRNNTSSDSKPRIVLSVPKTNTKKRDAEAAMVEDSKTDSTKNKKTSAIAEIKIEAANGKSLMQLQFIVPSFNGVNPVNDQDPSTALHPIQSLTNGSFAVTPGKKDSATKNSNKENQEKPTEDTIVFRPTAPELARELSKTYFAPKPKNHNYAGLNDNEVAILTKYCRHDLFRRVKFINDDLLSKNQKIVRQCFQSIGRESTDMRLYAPVTKMMKHATNSKRGYVTEEICKLLECK